MLKAACGPPFEYQDYLPGRHHPMTNLKKLFLFMLVVPAGILYTDVRTHAAGSPSQTILNPATPRKSVYPRIVIYTVSWCPHCRELKEYLNSRGIPFINRDVELEPAYMDEMVQKYKSYGVPVVVIGNDQEVLKGFTGEQFEKAIAKVRSGSK
jgi:glutaredoxin-like YruB-family protein